MQYVYMYLHIWEDFAKMSLYFDHFLLKAHQRKTTIRLSKRQVRGLILNELRYRSGYSTQNVARVAHL